MARFVIGLLLLSHSLAIDSLMYFVIGAFLVWLGITSMEVKGGYDIGKENPKYWIRDR